MLNKTQCKKELKKILHKLYQIEDSTNYDIKPLGKAITLIQNIDIDNEYIKYNK